MDKIESFKKITEVRCIRYNFLLRKIDGIISEIERIKAFNDNGFKNNPEFKKTVQDNVKSKEQTCKKLLHDAKINSQILLESVMFDDSVEDVIDTFSEFNFLENYNCFKELLFATHDYIFKFVNENKTEYKTLVLGNFKVIKYLKKCTNCYANVLNTTSEYLNNINIQSEKQSEN